jgi:hypothetical protein
MLLSAGVLELKASSHLCNVRTVSLNHAEQILFDYVERHAEERHFWQGKVRDLMSATEDPFSVSAKLALQLTAYWHERRGVGSFPPGGESDKNLTLISFRNLSDHLIRLWGPSRVRRPPARGGGDEIS